MPPNVFGVETITTETTDTQAGCPMERIAAALIERRLAAGEHPENVWGRADRALRGEEWTP